MDCLSLARIQANVETEFGQSQTPDKNNFSAVKMVIYKYSHSLHHLTPSYQLMPDNLLT